MTAIHLEKAQKIYQKLALYVASFKLSDKLSKLENLEYDKEYKINDIMEMLL